MWSCSDRVLFSSFFCKYTASTARGLRWVNSANGRMAPRAGERPWEGTNDTSMGDVDSMPLGVE